MPPVSVSFVSFRIAVSRIIGLVFVVFERLAAIFVGGAVGTYLISADGTRGRTVPANRFIADTAADKTIRADGDAADVADGNAVDFFEIGNAVGTNIFACAAKGTGDVFQTAVFADGRTADGTVFPAERADAVFAKAADFHEVCRTVGTHDRPATAAFGRTLHDPPGETFVTFDDIHIRRSPISCRSLWNR